MAAGKVCTGFSKSYVAKYNANAGIITFTEGRILARSVSVSIEPDAGSDNNFYADNQLAESESGTFTSGTLTLTVDGLFTSAERFIQGLPETSEDGWTNYGDNKNTPYIAVGFIARYQSDGVVSYVPTVIPKTKFGLLNQAAQTQTDTIEWQTQELTANIMRADDPNHNWKYIGSEFSSEADAERALQTKLGIYVVNPTMTAVGPGATLFGQLVGDMQSDVVVENDRITGNLAYLTDGDIVTTWGEGNFIALQFNNIDSRATSVRVGLEPSQGSGLIEIIDDPDKNGVFKITDKDAQKFVIISSDGENTATTKFDLSGLALAEG